MSLNTGFVKPEMPFLALLRKCLVVFNGFVESFNRRKPKEQMSCCKYMKEQILILLYIKKAHGVNWTILHIDSFIDSDNKL